MKWVNKHPNIGPAKWLSVKNEEKKSAFFLIVRDKFCWKGDIFLHYLLSQKW